MTARTLPPKTTGATAPGLFMIMLRTSYRPTSYKVASLSDSLSRATMPMGVELVGSNGRTTGGSVPGGIVAICERASELVSVSEPPGSASPWK